MSTEGGRGGREGGGGKKHIRILVQICIKSAFQWRILMGSPQRPITSLHPNPPMIGRSRFSTEIKLAQGRGRGEGYLQRKGGKMYNIYI